MRLLSLTLGAVSLIASLQGVLVVAEQGNARAAAPSSQDLGGRSQRYVARFAHETSQKTPVNSLFTDTTQLQRSIPTLTHSTSLNWGGSRSQRFVARYAQVTPGPDVHRADDQVAPAATTPPLCCFNEAKGQYDCPCHKTDNDKTSKLDQAVPPPQPCNACWSAIQECQQHCDGDEVCNAACACDMYWKTPMCRRCPWAVRECGNELTGDVVGACEEPVETITSNVEDISERAVPTTLATVFAQGSSKCKCWTCSGYGHCRYVPCRCGMSGAVGGATV